MIYGNFYNGRSQHPVLHTWEGTFYTIEIFDSSILKPWWKRLFSRSISLAEPFSNMTWELSYFEKGQSVLAEVRPKGGYLTFSELDKYKKWLEEQIKNNPTGKKSGFPPEKSTWPDNVFWKQYLFEIHERNQLINLFGWFRPYEMMNIFIFDVDAKIEECTNQLQKGLMSQPFDLESIVESLNAFVYCDWLGDRLIIESPREELIQRFAQARHIEPAPISSHPATPKKVRSISVGGRRLFP